VKSTDSGDHDHEITYTARNIQTIEEANFVEKQLIDTMFDLPRRIAAAGGSSAPVVTSVTVKK
jgi:hypothetical protein